MLDHMLGSLEEIEKFVGTHDALKLKIEVAKDHFENAFISKNSCIKQKDDHFKETFYGEITDALLDSVKDGKLYMFEGKVYEPETDQNNIMANILSEYLATAYKAEGAEQTNWRRSEIYLTSSQ